MKFLFVVIMTSLLLDCFAVEVNIIPFPKPLKKSWGVCDVRLPKICPNGMHCKEMLPAHHKHPEPPVPWRAVTVLSFDSILANGGHIGGRIAARNDINIEGGFLIGDQVVEIPSKIVKYSFVAGRTATWNQGTLLPNSEAAFVGSNFTGPDYLQSRVSGSCAKEGCLDIPFIKAQLFYVTLSNLFASLPSNVQVTYQYNGIYLSCSAPFSDGPTYVAYVDVSYFQGMSWYSVQGNCLSGRSWVINVVGTGDMIFQGGAFPGTAEQVLYNINGTRNIIVNTGVNGNILAPLSSYSQSNGNTNALIIVGDVSMIQTAYQPSCNYTSHRHKIHSDNNVAAHHKNSSQKILAPLILLLLAFVGSF